MIYNKYDIYLAKVVFEDNKEKAKIRPVLILENNKIYVICYKITSQINKYNEYKILNWEEAGLLKPSMIRTNKKLQINKTDIIKKLGHLSNIDIKRLEREMNKS